MLYLIAVIATFPKLYDTDTATKIADKEEYFGSNNFRNIFETLYKKKTGEFFLAGEGGPLTKYAEDCGEMKTFGEAIFPLTTEEAKNWAEVNMSAEDYIDLFGEPEK